MITEFLELKQNFAPLSEREIPPTEHGCIEDEVASKLFRSVTPIHLPHRDMIAFVLRFICECPDNDWDALKCPYSLFSINQIAPSQTDFIDKFAIFGEDVALVAYSLMRWYGSIELFNMLRRDWIFNMDQYCLERNPLWKTKKILVK